MQSKKIQILSTKILDHTVLEKAADQGIDITCVPFIETRPVLSEELVTIIGALSNQSITAVFTSSRSVITIAALLKQPVNWNIYCLFGATKEQAQFHFPGCTIHATATDSFSLAEQMLADGIKEACFFCGDKRMDTIPEKLAARGVSLLQYIVYTTHEVSQQIKEKFDGILFFSPSAVKSFFNANTITAATECFAVGNTTARSLEPFAHHITIAAVASGPAMLDQVINKFRNVK